MSEPVPPKFIADQNVGKLARWLRLMGYDAAFFGHGSDTALVSQAMAEGRVILTRDHELLKRRLVNSGKLRVAVFDTAVPEEQLCQLIKKFHLNVRFRPFSICIECNHLLEARRPEDVRERVPPYVFQTQTEFVECPQCRRIYWPGSHWQALNRELDSFECC